VRCERPDVVEACLRYAEVRSAALEQCGVTVTESLDEICPDFLAQACGACPERFDCLAANTACLGDGLYLPASECTCP